jgi:hypothetical protein
MADSVYVVIRSWSAPGNNMFDSGSFGSERLYYTLDEADALSKRDEYRALAQEAGRNGDDYSHYGVQSFPLRVDDETQRLQKQVDKEKERLAINERMRKGQ